MRLATMTILRNIAECRLCGDVIESKNRHDFIGCKCGEIFTDGGTAYIRRGANDFANVIDRSVIEPKVPTVVRVPNKEEAK
jgi:hypothetical protein